VKGLQEIFKMGKFDIPLPRGPPDIWPQSYSTLGPPLEQNTSAEHAQIYAGGRQSPIHYPLVFHVGDLSLPLGSFGSLVSM
jgi:hypothetical protein